MNPDGQSEKSAHRSVTVLQVLVMALASPLLMGLFLFLAAGDLTWLKGWLFVAVCLAANLVIVPYIWRVNPELIVARSHFRFAKGWDKVWTCVTIPFLAGLFIVAALDDGRFHWLPVPWWVCAIGYALLLPVMGVGSWIGA